MHLVSYLTFTFVAYCTPVTLAARCPITGPLLPFPKTLSTSSLVLDAGRRLKELLDSALTGFIEAGWQTNVTSFSIILTDAGEAPLWEYHHTASRNVNSTRNVDGDTQFMIASITKPDFESLGFPPLSESDYPKCGVIGLHPSCTKQQLLSGLLSSVPIFPPNTRPVYSSISFTLLGYVLEEVTGKTFREILDTEIIQPLGMENTGLQPQKKTSGVIPPVANVWGADFEDNTETASLYSLVGMPWEITRTANLTPEHPHIIDIYAKDGHVPRYTSRMAVIEEYNVGLLSSLLALLSVFMPVIEKATRDEATKYVGKFSTPANSTINSSITFTMDDGPGLSITEFISNSTNMLDTLATFWSLWPGSYGEPDLDLRIYPADISEIVDSNETNNTSGFLTREDWRLNMEPKSKAGSNESQLPS
ncbi:putative beta-lactamase [Morchella snyderi]|nr:putative beta-lactamase [Morchella snyderi]